MHEAVILKATSVSSVTISGKRKPLNSLILFLLAFIKIVLKKENQKFEARWVKVISGIKLFMLFSERHVRESQARIAKSS